MLDGVAPFLGGAAPWLLTYLLHSTALIAAAWALERTGVVRRPRSLDALWKAALLGGFVTSAVVVIRAASGPERALTQVRAVVRADAPPPVDGELTWAPPARATRVRAELVDPSPECRGLIGGTPGDGPGSAIGGAAGGPDWLREVRAACLPARFDRRAALVLAWTVGAAGALLLGWRARRRLHALLADVVPAGGRVAGLAEALTAELGRGRRAAPVPVAVSLRLPAPCAHGGRVLLPARCEQEMSDGELRAVLAHERAHLERHDPGWLGLADLVGRVAWIQPLNRVAAAGVRDAAELVADQRTLLHARPLDLARSIHRVSAWALPAAEVRRLAALTSPREGSLTRRVRRILQGGGAAGPAWPGALVALGLTAGALLLPPVATHRVLRAIVIERLEGGGVAEEAAAHGAPALLSGTGVDARVVVRAVVTMVPPPAGRPPVTR